MKKNGARILGNAETGVPGSSDTPKPILEMKQGASVNPFNKN
jgi:hypothetical protein